MVGDVFSRRLKMAREARGWTKAELLRQVNRTGRSNATAWEHGTVPDADTVRALAAKLGVSLDWLFGLDEVAGAETRSPLVLDEAVARSSVVMWGGRTVTLVERRRTMAVLHAMLAPLEELTYPQRNAQEIHKDEPQAKSKNTPLRATEIVSSGKARPRHRAGADNHGSVDEGEGHGSA